MEVREPIKIKETCIRLFGSTFFDNSLSFQWVIDNILSTERSRSFLLENSEIQNGFPKNVDLH